MPSPVVTGQTNSLGTKDYRIEWCSKTHLAVNLGNGKFRLDTDGYCNTLRKCKAHIQMATAIASIEAVVEDVAEDNGTWSCVHPCAFMILQTESLGPDALKTLDAFGWALEDGSPDVQKAHREMERFGSLKREAELDREPRYDATDDGPSWAQARALAKAGLA